ncbi:MAG: rod shape-determining protein MreC [Deltaproteobacteria bacterium]|nr:rod shape-determining protein MreC [Deltaproteobacteria bacterium]
MRSERYIVTFLKRHQITLASLLLALFSLHLALTDRKEVARGFILKEVLSITVTPMQRLVLAVSDGVAGIWSDYIFLTGVGQENDSLKNTVLSLQEENNRLREEVSLNNRLRDVLAYKESVPFKTVAASITGFNMDRWARTVTISKGSKEGIAKDLAVISLEGVVGRVIEVNRHTSRVLLTTDLRSDIDALVQRTRVKGVIEGSGTEGLIFKYIRQVDDVQIGDTVVTSALSGVFPKGLVIGEVTKIEKGRDNFFKYIEVRPKAEVRKIEEVLIVTETGFFEEE